MGDLVKFSDYFSRSNSTPAPTPQDSRAIHFSADLYLVNGKLGFSVGYPDGKIGLAVVAAMLRAAARAVDDSRPY